MQCRDLLSRLLRFVVVRRPAYRSRPRLEQLENRTTPTTGINLAASSFDVSAGRTQLVPLSLVPPPAPGTPVTYTARSSNSMATAQARPLLSLGQAGRSSVVVF
jgi:hypothetical protein